MKLKLVVVENCPACVRAEKQLQKFVKNNSAVNFEIINLSDYKDKNLAIIPALFLENELFSYGDINFNKLKKSVLL